MTKVTIGDHVLADSRHTIVIEGNHYFPPADIKNEFFQKSDTSSVCPWKGTASYYDATLDGETIKDVAWYYPHTITDKAKLIEGYVAFYKNKVKIHE